jgi:hypothetical protein
VFHGDSARDVRVEHGNEQEAEERGQHGQMCQLETAGETDQGHENQAPRHRRGAQVGAESDQPSDSEHDESDNVPVPQHHRAGDRADRGVQNEYLLSLDFLQRVDAPPARRMIGDDGSEGRRQQEREPGLEEKGHIGEARPHGTHEPSFARATSLGGAPREQHSTGSGYGLAVGHMVTARSQAADRRVGIPLTCGRSVSSNLRRSRGEVPDSLPTRTQLTSVQNTEEV